MLKPNTHKDTTLDLKKIKKSIDEDIDNDIDYGELSNIRNSIINSESIIDDITELMPNVELVMETITSLVVAPNNMIDILLNYSHDDIDLPPEVHSTINEYTRKYVNKTYGLHDNIQNIVKKSLYTKGAYIELNLPVSFINKLMKIDEGALVGTTASIVNKLDSRLGVESKKYIDDRVIITDSLSGVIIDNLVEEVELPNTEYHNEFSRLALTSATADKRYTYKKDITKNNGKPIVIEVNSRDIIPIASSRNPSKHYGYFYLVSNDIRNASINGYDDKRLTDIYSDINRVMSNSKDNIPTISNIDGIKKYVISNTLEEYIKGKVRDDVKIDIDDELSVILAEHIINKSDVKFIYLPIELVSYYAINFRENGTGKSLLEKIATLASIKNIIMFSNLTSLVKSNITTTEIEITLDENDPNYRQTIRKILKHVMENNNFNIPIRMLKVDNFINWSKELGYVVKTNGHPMLPDTQVTVTEKRNELKPVDTDVFEQIDNDIITGLYGIPEMMSNINSPDFATEVRHDFLMLDKRIRNLQHSYNKLMTKDVHKKLMLDSNYINTIKDIVRGNISSIKKYMKNSDNIDTVLLKSKDTELIVEHITYRIMLSRNVKLQQPLNKNDEVTIEDFNSYVDTVENTIEKLISSDAMPSDIVGKISDNLDSVKAALRVMMIRDYMSKNNILPEFNTMFTLNENGEPNNILLDNFREYFMTLSEIALQFIDDNKDDKDDVDKKLDNIENSDDKDDDEIVDGDIDEVPSVSEEPNL